MDEQTTAEGPREDPGQGARGETFGHLALAFGLVFVVGFAVVALVLLSSRKRRP